MVENKSVSLRTLTKLQLSYFLHVTKISGHSNTMYLSYVHITCCTLMDLFQPPLDRSALDVLSCERFLTLTGVSIMFLLNENVHTSISGFISLVSQMFGEWPISLPIFFYCEFIIPVMSVCGIARWCLSINTGRDTSRWSICIFIFYNIYLTRYSAQISVHIFGWSMI